MARDQKRHVGIWLGLIVVLAVGGYFLLNNENASVEEIVIVDQEWDAGIATLGGELVYTEGSVEYRSGDSEWTRAKKGTALLEGYSVEVVGEGRAIINLDDGSVLRLNSDSSITLASMDPNHMIIENNAGEVYSRVLKADRVFQVRLDSLIYESLGTAYKTSNYENKKEVEVYHSKVKVKHIEGEELAIVEEGQKYVLELKDDVLEKALEDISDGDLEKEFVVWNMEEDTKGFENELGVLKIVEEAEDEVEDPEESVQDTVSSKSITLTYGSNGNVSWKSSFTSKDGYKLIWSKTTRPTYPARSGDKSKYYSSSSAVSGAVHAFDGGGTYYIRVCQYLDGSCGVYSNQVTATFIEAEEPKELKEEVSQSVSSISLSGTGKSISWSAVGESSKGFKVVWSKNVGPTYPTRSGDKYQYFSDPSQSSAMLKAFDGAGTYYVKVCEYLSGSCGAYSNQITVELQ